MYDSHSTKTKWRIEVENRQRVPQRTWLPPYAAQRLWALAKARGEHPSETASQLLLERLYPHKVERRKQLRAWRREIWTRGWGIRKAAA